MRGVDHVIEYHAVAQGSCWAGIPGGPSVQLFAGDVVMFPHGDAHVVSSAPGHARRRRLRLVRRDARSTSCRCALPTAARACPASAPPDGDADTTIVCGFLGCDLQPFNPLIAALPRLLHLRAGDDDAWIARFTQQAVAESHAQRPGGEAMLARMSEMMFVDAVRRYADRLPTQSRGLARRPARPLRRPGAGADARAAGAGLDHRRARPARRPSRSALHERFVQLIGVPPMQYLAQWRMQAAARLLLETRATVAAIALDVGYDSEAAFARAFKRLVGMPPGAWRRERGSDPE